MRSRHRLISMLLCTFLISLAYDAKAIPVPFKLTLEVTDVFEDPLCTGGSLSFGCDNAPGDIHTGFFSVDSSLLALEGDNLPGGVSNFFLRIGNVVWDQANPSPASDFFGFRDAAGHFAPSFDVDVHGGTITDVHGGVFAPADLPAIDFAPLAGLSPGTFEAVDGTITTDLRGTLQVSRVSEPSVLFLAGIGLSVWVLLRRRPALARWRRPVR